MKANPARPHASGRMAAQDPRRNQRAFVAPGALLSSLARAVTHALVGV